MRVLIIEPNPFHFETIPGYCRYFIALGYDVDILTMYVSAFGDVFSSIPDSMMKHIRHFYYDLNNRIAEIEKIIKDNNYEVIFLNTVIKDASGSKFEETEKPIIEYIDSLKLEHCIKIGIAHGYPTDKQKQIGKDWNIFILSNLSETVPFATPYYLGEFKNKKTRYKKCRILGIGASISRKELELFVRKSYFSSEKIRFTFLGEKTSLYKRVAKRLFFNVCHKYEIKPFCNDYYRPDDLKLAMMSKYYGRVSFPKMYRIIQKNDFLFMDLENPKNNFDYKKQTSGTKQLSLAFLKPCITSRNVAEAYGFDNSNAIIFETGKIDSAIEKAINMSNEEYTEMCNSLAKLRENVFQESLKNIKSVLSATER